MGQKTAHIKDLVWLNTRAKLNGLIARTQSTSEQSLLIISHFKQSALELAAAFKSLALPFRFYEGNEKFERVLKEQKVIILLSERLTRDLSNLNSIPVTVNICAAERYPLAEPEQELAALLCHKFALETLEVYSSLDDPLLKYYGGPHLQALFTTMGMAAEPIEGEIMSRAIEKAQRTMRKKVRKELRCDSAQEWYTWNIEKRSD